MTDPHAEARRIAEEARQWRMWATGERKEPPHNLLAFTTDVIDLSAREERLEIEAESGSATVKMLMAENERLREALSFYAQQRGLGSRLASDGGKIARNALSTPEADAEARAEHLREAREVEAWQEAKHARREEGSP